MGMFPGNDATAPYDKTLQPLVFTFPEGSPATSEITLDVELKAEEWRPLAVKGWARVYGSGILSVEYRGKVSSPISCTFATVFTLGGPD